MAPRNALVVYSAMMLAISAMAYLRLLPTELQRIPYYDSAGHFILYGIWGWLFAKAFSRPILKTSGFVIPLGFCIIIPMAAVEEYSQAFSSARTFSFFDFMWGFLGILTACVIFNFAKPMPIRQ